MSDFITKADGSPFERKQI